MKHQLMSSCPGPSIAVQGAAFGGQLLPKPKIGFPGLLVLPFLHFPGFLVKSLQTQSLAGALSTEDVSRGVLWRGDALCEVCASTDAPGLKSN